MKAIIKRPSQRLLLTVLSTLMVVSGCSGIQSNAAYQKWEQQAYKAYGMAVPKKTSSVMPAMFKTISTTSKQLLKRPTAQLVVHRRAAPVAPVRQSKPSGNGNNAGYIEQHYGL